MGSFVASELDHGETAGFGSLISVATLGGARWFQRRETQVLLCQDWSFRTNIESGIMTGAGQDRVLTSPNWSQ